MKINIAQTKKEVGSILPFSFAVSSEQLALDSEHYLPNELVLIRGEVVNNGAALKVKGEITVKARYVCNRCLEPFVSVTAVPFTELYKPAMQSGEAQELDVSYYQGDEIDLADVVRENILLAEPLKMVCSEECRGLCPVCGVNLNASTCNCNQHSIDPRLAALQQLLKEKT